MQLMTDADIAYTLLSELKQKCYLSKEYTAFIASEKENAIWYIALFILSLSSFSLQSRKSTKTLAKVMPSNLICWRTLQKCVYLVYIWQILIENAFYAYEVRTNFQFMKLWQVSRVAFAYDITTQLRYIQVHVRFVKTIFLLPL